MSNRFVQSDSERLLGCILVALMVIGGIIILLVSDLSLFGF